MRLDRGFAYFLGPGILDDRVSWTALPDVTQTSGPVDLALTAITET